jgi:flagellar biosynthesis component FlhA
MKTNPAVVGVDMEPKLEQMISDGLRTAAKEGSDFALPTAVTQRLIGTLKQLATGMLNRGFQPIVVTAPGTRGFIKNY